MRIISSLFHKFIPFKFADITTLSMEITSPIQIFIGDNGSGKSSLLNELHPFAAIKPMYEKNGEKRIVLDHKGSIYTLSSDFGKSGHAHSFIRDDEELNTSGTSGVQNELVEHYLGYNSLVHGITHMNYKMCQMGKAERKQLLININPVDLSLVLEKFKLILSKIKECKNNITLLYKKSQEIQTSLLPDSVREDLENRRKQQSEQLTTLTSELFHLTTLKEDIRRNLSELVEPVYQRSIELEDIPRFCKTKLIKYIVDLKDVDRSKSEKEHQEECTKLRVEVDHKENILSEKHRTLGNIQNDIEIYTKHMEELDSSVSAEDIEKELKFLMSQTYDIDDRYPAIPIEQLDRATDAVNRLIQYVGQFRELNLKLIVDTQKLRALNEKYALYADRIRELGGNLTRAKTALDEYIKERDELILTVPCDRDVRSSCDLYRTYGTRRSSIEEKIRCMEKSIAEYSKQIETLDKRQANLWEILDPYSRGHELIVSMVRELTTIAAFEWYSVEQVAFKLKESPDMFIRYYTESIRMSPKYHQKKLDTERCEYLREKLKSLISTGLPSIDFVKQLITTQKEKQNVVLTEIAELQNELDQMTTDLQNESRFLQISCLLEECQTRIDYELQSRILNANLEFCCTCIEQVKRQIDTLNTSLREIDVALKDQTGLLARLKDTEETIAEITKRKADLELVAKGISPYSGFPHKHMIDFTNLLIHNVNCVVSQVWSYQMNIVPLTYDDQFDCTFEVMVDNVKVPDLSSLSKAQQAMMNIAWTLAFVIGKKLTDYPLFLDECDEGFDPAHKQSLLEWLKSIPEQNLVSQLWMVHHEAILYDGFADSEVLCLKDGNILKPEKMNNHASIQ